MLRNMWVYYIDGLLDLFPLQIEDSVTKLGRTTKKEQFNTLEDNE